MNGDLAVAIAVFLVGAAFVILFGTRLAVYGDILATLTGWGRLFVGSMLVAVATSLPELSTSISAVRLDPPNPDLAVGTVLGANMLNLFKLAVVALIFGGTRFLRRVAPEQGYLIVLAIALTGAAVLFGAVRMDASLWDFGLSSGILIVLFVAGMRVVYVTRPGEVEDNPVRVAPGMTLRRTWVVFLGVSAGVVVAGFFVAWSADQIAHEAGVASSTLGILAVALVASLPEASLAFAAARIGAVDLAVAAIYGSNAINITILGLADPFYRGGILGNHTEAAHFIAGGVAIGLMLMGMVLILGRNRIKGMVATASLVLMALIYVAAAVTVVKVGGTDQDDGAGTPSAERGLSGRLWQ